MEVMVATFHREVRLTLFVLSAMAGPALAILSDYEIGNASKVSVNSGPGLIVNASLHSDLTGRSFTLDDGQSATFGFFNIWTNEGSVNDDDRVPKSISATLDFADPNTGAVVNGVTVGGSLLLFEGGRVQWSSPALVSFADRVFTVALSDETFNVGLFGINGGRGNGASVRATVSQVSWSTARVPDTGSSAALLGFAVAAITVLARRKIRPGLTQG